MKSVSIAFAAAILTLASGALATPTQTISPSLQCDPPAGGSGLVLPDIAAVDLSLTVSEVALLGEE
ncbi:hypothetical protein BDZ97DRAFT_1920890 [Flammula alnicola]|nr:hypothetical protein BDZ97DRAFT_1920890 [Flammula alnicola]